MTSPVVELWTLIEDELEALTPPDRTDVPYHRVDGPDTLEGGSGDREFWFSVGDATINNERGAAYTEYRHTFDLTFRLNADGYVRRDFEARIVNEAVMIGRAIDVIAETRFPTGVFDLISNGYRVGARNRDQVIVTIPLSVVGVEA